MSKLPKRRRPPLPEGLNLKLGHHDESPLMRLNGVDMNLLVALDALLAERNVTLAAARMGITQSAMSHALARLRALTGDELLVRQGRNRMVLTMRGTELAVPVRQGLEELSGALAPPRAFDPKSARLRVFLATGDYVAVVLLPRVMARLDREAPGIELRVLPLEEDLGSRLSSGAIALAIAPVRAGDLSAGLYSKKLFDEGFVCVVRPRHPLAGKKLDVARFAAAAHALVTPRGLDDAQTHVGFRRHVTVTVPYFLVAPYLIASRDLVLALPERLANVLAKPIGLTILKPPPELKLPIITISALWHERTHASPEHRWVRALFEEEASALASRTRISTGSPARGGRGETSRSSSAHRPNRVVPGRPSELDRKRPIR